MQALYWKAPDAEELSALGLTLEDYPPPSDVPVWEENWPALQLYMRNATQWRVGAAGPIGLDYGVIYHELDRQGLASDEYDDMMGCIRTIESAVLDLRTEE